MMAVQRCRAGESLSMYNILTSPERNKPRLFKVRELDVLQLEAIYI